MGLFTIYVYLKLFCKHKLNSWSPNTIIIYPKLNWTRICQKWPSPASRVASGKSTLPSCPADAPSLASRPILYLTGVVNLQTHGPPSLFSIISGRRLASIYAAREIWTADHQDHHQNQCRHNKQDHDWVDTGLGLPTSWWRGWTVANQEFVAVGNNYFYAVLCMTKSHRRWKLRCQKSIQEKVIYDG